MEERRENQRFSIRLGGHYLKENEEEWKDCTVTNISRSGMGIIVYIHERIPIGSSLQIKIVVPKRKGPLNVKITGILRWIKEEKERRNFIGGIEFTEILDEIEWANLIYFMS